MFGKITNDVLCPTWPPCKSDYSTKIKSGGLDSLMRWSTAQLRVNTHRSWPAYSTSSHFTHNPQRNREINKNDFTKHDVFTAVSCNGNIQKKSHKYYHGGKTQVDGCRNGGNQNREYRVQYRVTSYQSCGGRSGPGAGFSTSFFGFPLLIITRPLIHPQLSPPFELCDSPDQAPHYHIPRFWSWRIHLCLALGWLQNNDAFNHGRTRWVEYVACMWGLT